MEKYVWKFLNLAGFFQKCLEDVKIEPDHHSKRLAQLVENRPYWCISRQRVWGVPIPVLIDTESNETVISKYCRQFENNYVKIVQMIHS